jgi:nickel-dependent lactate racemase
MAHRIKLPYGRGYLEVDLLPYAGHYTVFEYDRRQSRPEIGVEELFRSYQEPIGTPPLRELIRPEDAVCIVTGDGTRPYVPMRLMLHTVLDHLGFIPAKTTVITGSGSHQPHTDDELRDLFCVKLLSSLNIISHDSRSEINIEVGRLADRTPVTMNRNYLEADRKIVLGHIEPHLFAGYTGGPKGIVPAVCGIETIHRLHSFDVIGDRTSRYGDIENNATTALIREMAAMAPPDFMVNLALNEKQKPIGVFSGHYIEAHRAGVEFVREYSEVTVKRRYPVVITSNSGHPLDQNLYQSVKGIDAAFHLAEPGGAIIIAAECARGIPESGRFGKLLASASSPETLLTRLANDNETIDDRWQVQRLCRLLQERRIILVSSLDKAATEACLLEYAPNVESALKKIAAEWRGSLEIAVITDGPLTIPVIAGP